MPVCIDAFLALLRKFAQNGDALLIRKGFNALFLCGRLKYRLNPPQCSQFLLILCLHCILHSIVDSAVRVQSSGVNRALYEDGFTTCKPFGDIWT